jgi:hypothetical protein
MLMALAFAVSGSLASTAIAAHIHPLKGTLPLANAEPSGIGIDEGTGNVFVNFRSPEPAVRILGAAGGAPVGVSNPELQGFAQSNESNGVAVDNAPGSLSEGDFYAVDVGNNSVKKYSLNPVSEEYEFVDALTPGPGVGEPLGVAVDTVGNVFVAYFVGASVVEFDPSGIEVGRIETGSYGGAPSSVAVDANGNLYTQFYGSGKVLRFEANGSGEVEPGTEPSVLVANGARGVAVNVNTNMVFVALQQQIREYSPAGLLESEFGSGTLGVTERLAVNAVTGDIYVVDYLNKEVAIFSTLVIPSPVTGAAIGAGADGIATLTGSVDPDGAPVTECYFEYGSTTAYGSETPCDKTPTEIGSGEAPVDVAAELSDLQPGVYHFRLVAANTNGSNRGDDETFAIPGPPSVFGESANSTETEADLRAQVDPANAETTYHFEFGPTENYGQSTPERTIAAGTEAVGVAAHISGLVPGQTYHFRAVASNEVDITLGTDRTFTTEVFSPGTNCPPATEESPGFRSYLPECRAYEMVSPPFTGGVSLYGAYGLEGSFDLPVSQDGRRVLASSLGNFAGQESGSTVTDGLGTSYLLTRTHSGWQPAALNPSSARFPFQRALDADLNLERTLWRLGDSTVLEGSSDYYIREPDGVFVRIGPDTHESSSGEGALPAVNRSYFGASTSLSRIVFGLRADDQLGAVSSQRGALWPGDETISGNNYSLYEYNGVGNAEPKLVAVTNEGMLDSNQDADLIGQCGAQLGSGNLIEGAGGGDVYNAVSPSGFAVFFTVLEGPCASRFESGTGPTTAELFARVEGTHTIAISEPSLSVPGRKCTGICRETQDEEGGHTRSPGRFLGASADGRKVYFLTSQPLVDSDGDEGPDLYLAELSSTAVTRLVEVSDGSQGASTPDDGSNVLGVSRVSQDGSRVYFVAKDVLTTDVNGNGEAAAAGANNLYLYESSSGRTAFVTQLSTADSRNWAFEDARAAQASIPDGRFLVFSSFASPQATGDTSPASQLFRYDAEGGDLVRVSVGQRGTYFCPQSGGLEVGYNCNGNVQSQNAAPQSLEQEFTRVSKSILPNMKLGVTSEGTVFFQSKGALTPAAANGSPSATSGLRNVYQYKNGQVYLISDGQEALSGAVEIDGEAVSSTFLSGVLADGKGVLLFSPNQLVPQDSDSLVSIYDAEVNGGFPAPSQAAGCVGEICRETLRDTPLMPSAGSNSSHSQGNVKPRKRCAKKHRHKGKCVNRKHKARDGKSRQAKSTAGGH